MTVTVPCLIKARDKEAASRGAVEQEVSGETEPKTRALENGKMIVAPFSSPHSPLRVLMSLSSQSRNFHSEASLNLHTSETELA